jgi:predicted RNA binding protein YcfA (HicA-like mRNA interferase family)
LNPIVHPAISYPSRSRLWRVKRRELIRDLEKAGFKNRGGKGSHRNFEHPRGQRVTLSGQPGADAKPYQEREVKRAIAESEL